MSDAPQTVLLAAIERSRKRLWGVCYRMTGSRADADDLCQEAIARALERADDLADRAAAEGWLFRIVTTVCLDHVRRETRARRVTDLVDPLDLPELAAGGEPVPDPEAAAILRDDVRFAVVTALQHLSAGQRAVLVLHDVCDRPLADVATALGTNPNAAKAMLHRARVALAAERRHTDVDRVADPAVVERVARAIETRAIGELTALLADDVWGIVDGGGVVPVATKPSIGRRAVARRWENASRRFLADVACRVRALNGEPAAVITLPMADHQPFASVHVETRRGAIVALRVVRDPRKLAGLRPTAA
jgi:RNA polymerase sigma-70 factor (ECF subfamily)